MPNAQGTPVNRFANANVYDSTVGITVYNLLQQLGVWVSGDDLFARVRAVHRDVERDQFDRSMAELVRRSWIQQGDEGYKTQDQKRRVVVDRDRGGMEAMLGVLQGGWKGWQVREQTSKGLTQRPLEDALAEGTDQ